MLAHVSNAETRISPAKSGISNPRQMGTMILQVSGEGDMFEIVGGMIVLTIMILLSGLKVVNEHDRLVVFRLGKALHTKGPGLQLIIPIIDRAQTVDTRKVTIPIPMLEDTTHDKYQVRMSALLMFSITDPKKSVLKVDDAVRATREFAEVSVRNLIRQHNLVQLMTDRHRLSNSLKAHLNKHTREWGVHVSTIEIKELKVPRDTKRLMTKSKPQADQAATELIDKLHHLSRAAD